MDGLGACARTEAGTAGNETEIEDSPRRASDYNVADQFEDCRQFRADQFEVGHRKPSEDIYEIALETARVEAPEESLFIDDLYENIQAARGLGMNAIHFQSIEKLKVKLNNVGLKLS